MSMSCTVRPTDRRTPGNPSAREANQTTKRRHRGVPSRDTVGVAGVSEACILRAGASGGGE
eukprot:8928578-Alexandrium_andersonii.AAC.1